MSACDGREPPREARQVDAGLLGHEGDPALEARAILRRQGLRGQHDDGRSLGVAFRAQLVDDGEAVDLRHEQVHDDDGRRHGAHEVGCLLTTGTRVHLPPEGLEGAAHELERQRVVVDDDRAEPARLGALVGPGERQQPGHGGEEVLTAHGFDEVLRRPEGEAAAALGLDADHDHRHVSRLADRP